MLAVGDLYPVWWETFRRDAHGQPQARVIAIAPYRGMYPQFFSHDLTLEAPNTRSGQLIMPVKLVR